MKIAAPFKWVWVCSIRVFSSVESFGLLKESNLSSYAKWFISYHKRTPLKQWEAYLRAVGAWSDLQFTWHLSQLSHGFWPFWLCVSSYSASASTRDNKIITSMDAINYKQINEFTLCTTFLQEIITRSPRKIIIKNYSLFYCSPLKLFALSSKCIAVYIWREKKIVKIKQAVRLQRGIFIIVGYIFIIPSHICWKESMYTPKR